MTPSYPLNNSDNIIMINKCFVKRDIIAMKVDIGSAVNIIMLLSTVS